MARALSTGTAAEALQLTAYNPQMSARPAAVLELLVPAAAAAAGLAVWPADGERAAALPCQLSPGPEGGESLQLLSFEADLAPLGLRSFVVGRSGPSSARLFPRTLPSPRQRSRQQRQALPEGAGPISRSPHCARHPASHAACRGCPGA